MFYSHEICHVSSRLIIKFISVMTKMLLFLSRAGYSQTTSFYSIQQVGESNDCPIVVFGQ